MKLEDVHAALPADDSPVWNWSAIISFALAVLPEVLQYLIGSHEDYQIPETWVRYFQLALVIVGIISAKMGKGWAPKQIWSEDKRLAYRKEQEGDTP